MFDRVLSNNDFIMRDDGIYVATILGTTHKLDGSVFIERFVKPVGGGQYEDALYGYNYDAVTGDVKIYVEEPGAYKVTLNQVLV